MVSVLFLAVFDQPIMDSSVIGCWSVAERLTRYSVARRRTFSARLRPGQFRDGMMLLTRYEVLKGSAQNGLCTGGFRIFVLTPRMRNKISENVCNFLAIPTRLMYNELD